MHVVRESPDGDASGAEPEARRGRKGGTGNDNERVSEMGSRETRNGATAVIAAAVAALVAGAGSGGLRQRRRRRRRDGEAGRQAVGQPDDLQLAPLHRPRQGRHRRRVRKGDRGQRQVHRGHQRQRRILRQGAAAARTGRIGRAQPLRRHRLDGETRCTTSATCRDVDKRAFPNVEKNLCQVLQQPSFDPNREFSVPWQSGMGGLSSAPTWRRKCARSATCSTPSTRARSTS